MTQILTDSGNKRGNERPSDFSNYIGQSSIKERIRISIQAASNRGDALPHVLISGRAGTGKTSLATVIANELGVKIHTTVASAISKPGDIMPLLVAIRPKEILFLDEIHRLPIKIEEFLYSVIEDFKVTMITERNVNGQSIGFPISPFTLIGATTLAGNLSAPLRERFPLQFTLNCYTNEELIQLMQQLGRSFGLILQDNALNIVAKCSRGVPRICKRLFNRIRDFMDAKRSTQMTDIIIQQCFDLWKIDEIGLEEIDRQYLFTLMKTFDGGPAGVKSLACSMDVDEKTISEMIEPFLLSRGFIIRSPRGRKITTLGMKHLEVVNETMEQ